MAPDTILIKDRRNVFVERYVFHLAFDVARAGRRERNQTQGREEYDHYRSRYRFLHFVLLIQAG
jgi:hypothetical protein